MRTWFAEVGLVGVDADPADVLLLGCGQSAEAALAGDLEDDMRPARDLVERELLALRLVDEVLRVGVQRRDPWAGLLRAGAVARDVPVHGRDLQPADRADHLLRASLLLGDEPGEIADQVARLLLLEEQAADVLRLRLHLLLREVDDREVRVGELLRDGVQRVGHQEADGDHEVVLRLREAGEVRDVVGVRARDDDASLHAELVLGLLEALVREEVERAVVETADIRHQPDLERRPARGFRGRAGGFGRRRCTGRLVVVTTAAGERQQQRRGEREHSPECGPATTHHGSHTGRGGIETRPFR